MKPFIYSSEGENNAIFQAKLFCTAVSLLLLTTSSAYSQPIDSNTDSALARSSFLQTQILDVPSDNPEYGNFDHASINKLVQLAEAQSLIGEYENAIRSLEDALQASRIHNGLYHYSQIEIVDKLIANEVLRENWEAVNDYYDLEEHLLRRLFEPTDARLEIGLEKITAWHIRAINEEFDSSKQEHFAKAQELLAIRLTLVENLLGNDNARYDFIFNNLAYAEIELEKLKLRRMSGAGSSTASYSPMKIE